MQSDRLAILQISLGAIMISFAPVFVKLSSVNPVAEGVYRGLFGGIALLFVCLIRREKLWQNPQALLYTVLGACFFAGDLWCWQSSIKYIGPGLATILGNFQVFCLALIGVVFFGERFGKRKLLALPLAMIGLLMLVGIKWSALTPEYHLGILLGLATAIFYAGYVLVLRQAQKLEKPYSPVANLTLLSFNTAIIMSLMAHAQGEPLALTTFSDWSLMICYGIFCQAIGWLVISSNLTKIPVSLSGFLLLFQPSLAFVWDILFFHRPTPPIEIVGAFITLVAIYLGSSPGKAPKQETVVEEETLVTT